MTKRMWLLVGSLVLVLTSPGVVRAEPIFFTTSGHIRIGDGAVETFQGSFWLGDPVTSMFGPDDSRGDQLDRYSVSTFTLTSASYSLTGGAGTISLWWAINRDDRGIFLNTLDSAMFLTTSLGALETDFGFTRDWFGAPGVQPLGFSGLPADIFNTNHLRTGRILDISAQRARVPEPSTLLLMGAGITGLVMRRRRRRS